jgi:hypothetical protein
MTDPDNSIATARLEADEASGYVDLVEEVEAVEFAVDGETPAAVKAEVVALRNRIERPPLKQDASNDVNSAQVRKANVDRVRAVAQALAPKV